MASTLPQKINHFSVQQGKFWPLDLRIQLITMREILLRSERAYEVRLSQSKQKFVKVNCCEEVLRGQGCI